MYIIYDTECLSISGDSLWWFLKKYDFILITFVLIVFIAIVIIIDVGRVYILFIDIREK